MTTIVDAGPRPGETGGKPTPESSKNKLSAAKDRVVARTKDFTRRVKGFMRLDASPHQVLEAVSKDKGERLPGGIRDRAKRFISRDRLTPGDKAYVAKGEHSDDIQKRLTKLNQETPGKLTRRAQKENYTNAIRHSRDFNHDVDPPQLTRQDVLQQAVAARKDDVFQTAVKDEISRRQAANEGKPIGRLERVRIERQMLADKIQDKPVTTAEKQAAQAKAEAEEATRAEQKRAEDAKAAETRRDRLKDPAILAEYTKRVSEATLSGRDIPRTEANQIANQVIAEHDDVKLEAKKISEGDARRDGVYGEVFAEMYANPANDELSPEDFKEKAMAEATKRMEQRIAAAKQSSDDTEPEGPTEPKTDAETGTANPTAEAGTAPDSETDADRQSEASSAGEQPEVPTIESQTTDILKQLNIDPGTEQGKKAQTAIEAALKTLSGDEGEGGKDKKANALTIALAVITALLSAGVFIVSKTTEAAESNG